LVAVAVSVLLLPPVLGLVWLLSHEQIRARAQISGYHTKAEHHAELEQEFSWLAVYSDSSHAIGIRGDQRVDIPIRQRPELIPKYLELAKYQIRRNRNGSLTPVGEFP
jgi:hypothetical protein